MSSAEFQLERSLSIARVPLCSGRLTYFILKESSCKPSTARMSSMGITHSDFSPGIHTLHHGYHTVPSERSTQRATKKKKKETHKLHLTGYNTQCFLPSNTQNCISLTVTHNAFFPQTHKTASHQVQRTMLSLLKHTKLHLTRYNTQCFLCSNTQNCTSSGVTHNAFSAQTHKTASHQV